MIRLEKRRGPEIVPDVLRLPKVARALVRLAESVERGRPELNPDIWSAARAELRREANGKCAYCESRADAVSVGDVEHFRPKCTWWWLAYFWGNYLYSCESCNRLYKRDRFPLEGEPFRPAPIPDALPDAACEDARWRAFLGLLAGEKPLLPNPYEVDPEPLFAFQADRDRGEVVMLPAKRSGFERRSAEAAIEVFGLNREALRRERWRTWRELELLIDSREAVRCPKLRARIAEELEAAVAPEAEFAAMARWLMRSRRVTSAKTPRRDRLKKRLENRRRNAVAAKSQGISGGTGAAEGVSRTTTRS